MLALCWSNGLTKFSTLASSSQRTYAADRSDPGVGALLDRLRSSQAQEAWEEFLFQFSDTLYQVAGISSRSEEEAAECFVFVCEKLAENSFRRLLRFKRAGTATFSTWLRVVAKNLCFDWQRKIHGRPRPFKSLRGLTALDLEVYHCRYERGLSIEDTLQALRSSWNALTASAVNESENRIEGLLSPRQHWILAARHSSTHPTPLSIEDESNKLPLDVADPSPGPESRLWQEEQQSRLLRCLQSLAPEERLLLQFRFEDELSLQEIANLLGIGDPQRAHRKILGILQKLRVEMEK
jgi:RNA polymerase sigma factor (sigma-70 family)